MKVLPSWIVMTGADLDAPHELDAALRHRSDSRYGYWPNSPSPQPFHASAAAMQRLDAKDVSRILISQKRSLVRPDGTEFFAAEGTVLANARDSCASP
jgi:hypothetical protein